MREVFIDYLIWLICSIVGGVLGILIWEFLVRFKNGCKEIAEDMEKYTGLKLMFAGVLIAIPAVVTIPLCNLLFSNVFELCPGLLKSFIWICAGMGIIAMFEFIVGLVRVVSSIRHGY